MNKTAQSPISAVSSTIVEFDPEVEAIWQRELAQACRDPHSLLKRLGLSTEVAASCVDEFPLLVPDSFIDRMQPGNPQDPLLRQVLPLPEEDQIVDGFELDPVADLPASPEPGLIHKYSGRVLLITVGSCAVHCRYCFRRHFPYQDSPRSLERWQPVFEQIEQQPEIEEVILSGGDPLTLNNRRLSEMIGRLSEIPHLQRLRIHSRLPIVLPSRVTAGLLHLLTQTRLQTFFVVHANHAHELTGDCAAAVKRLVQAGIPTLNQAVLLRGINDSTEAQLELCRRLINLGVIPYYLNQLDRVQGAAHFEVPERTGRQIIQALKQQLPGYAVPRYVVDLPEQGSKVEILTVE